MHEFELGVWKSILIHLLRLLIALGGDMIQELDRRFVDSDSEDTLGAT